MADVDSIAVTSSDEATPDPRPSRVTGRMTSTAVVRRTELLFRERYHDVAVRTDRMFAILMVVQWIAAIGFAYWFSPYAWAGKEQVLHAHVYAALLLGGIITSLPVGMVLLQPGTPGSRYAVACGQMLWSALLIHLTGGRIETHFHVFGSLAILAFYRDLRVLVPATVVVALDHFIRGMYWPESVYGVMNPEWWRFLEHAGWVVFIDVFLLMNCVQARRELWGLCAQQAQIETSQQRMLRVEKLAAVGQLAASVGHELRNPLAAVRNAHSFIRKKLGAAGSDPVTVDPKVHKFLELMDRELEATAKIITNLLDFARTKDPVLSPAPLRPLVTEAIELVVVPPGAEVVNDVPDDLPVPQIDRDKFRQVFVNLVQNAVDALPPAAERSGRVTVSASGGGAEPWQIRVSDNGKGMTPDVVEKVFQPLFSTKTKGTGLGLAVVANIVELHGGAIDVKSEPGQGTEFIAELPPAAARQTEAA